MTKPQRRARVATRPLGGVDGAYTGDDVDFDGDGYAGEASVNDQWKQPVRCATTANITISTALNNADTLDGVTLATGDRVLVKDQSTGAQNGIYIVGATPARAADMDDDDEVLGALVYVIAGTTNAATAWKVTNTSAVTVDTTAIVFAAFGAGASFGTPALTLSTSNSAGAASTAIRTDATVAVFDATAPTTQALGDSAAAGSAGVAARRDHKHAMPAAAVTTSGLTMATARLLGRSTASTGAIEEITVGTGLSLSAGSLTATGSGGSITVEEVDGSPTDSAVTKLVFPNGTLGIVSHVATYTPAAGGGLAQSFLGYNTVGGTFTTLVAKRVYCKSITLSAAGVITSIDVHVRGRLDAVGGMVVSVLDDNSSAPGKLLGGGTLGGAYLSTSSSMPTVGRWLAVPVGAYLAAGTYWICFQTNDTNWDVANDGSGADQTFNPTIYMPTSAYPSAWAITTGTVKYSIRASILS